MEIKTIFLAIALLTTFSSCSEVIDNPTAEPSQESVQLEITISDKIESKTLATDEGETYSVTWTGTETVSVNGQHSKAIDVDASNPKCAVFTFDGVTAPYASVYPASACKSVSGITGTVCLPSEQRYVKDSFDPNAALMLGYSQQEGKVEFHHAVSYLDVK